MTDIAIFDDDERAFFASSVDRFVDERYSFDRHRALARSMDGFGRGEWREMAELGCLALIAPVEQGGLGGGAREAAIIMVAVGRGLLLEPFLATGIIATELIARVADDARKAELLSRLVAGECLYALAEQDGGEAVVARNPEGGWRLDGSKTLVLHGDVADRLLVTAPVGEGTGLFLIDTGASGVFRSVFTFIDGRRGADIRFADVVAERLDANGADAALDAVRDRATLAVCAEAVGAMTALNTATLAYLKTRQQFGVAIGSFQALQHRLVDMSVAESEARSIVAAAADAIDTGHPRATMLVSAAKVRINRAGRLVGEGAVQLHGGIGMTEELVVGHYFKRLLTIGALFGDCDHHLDRLAEAV